MTNLAKRLRAEKRLKAYGRGAIAISFSFLFFLMFTIISKGIGGFENAQIRLDVNFEKDAVETENYTSIIRASLLKEFPVAEDDIETKKQLFKLVSGAAKFRIQNMVTSDKNLIGKTVPVWFPADEKIEIYMKKNSSDWNDNISDNQKQWVKKLQKEEKAALKFNSNFFSNGDSQDPEEAGIYGSLIGSILTITCAIAFAIPFAVLTAIYLEEFSPKNRITDLIEVNINNLAAVPSIIYGLLGLSVYLNFFGMPRSAPLVGGLTLALMIIPVIIIATRASLKAVPPSIRQAAMGIGASPLQVVMHHTLPLAMPGIMTGTILGLARALGETAPLLMIGMVAFIADVPHGFTDPATVMPVQIFLWSKNNQPGFVEKTAAAIMVLLAILILLNIIAVMIRKKYERRW